VKKGELVSQPLTAGQAENSWKVRQQTIFSGASSPPEAIFNLGTDVWHPHL